MSSSVVLQIERVKQSNVKVCLDDGLRVEDISARHTVRSALDSAD